MKIYSSYVEVVIFRTKTCYRSIAPLAYFAPITLFCPIAYFVGYRSTKTCLIFKHSIAWPNVTHPAQSESNHDLSANVI